MVFLASVAVIGLIGNSLVLFVYTRRFPQTPVRVFLIAVAVFDIIINTVVIPGEIYDLLNSWCFDKPVVCQVRLYFTVSTTMASAFLLLALAVTRYRKICQPFSTQVTINQAKVICFVVVIVTHLLPVPYTIIHGRQRKKTERLDVHGFFCAVDDRYVNEVWPKLNSGFFCLLFLINCTILVALYTLIWSKARKHRGNRTTVILAVKKQGEDNMSRNKICSVTSLDEAASSSDTGIKSMQTGDFQFDTQSASPPPPALSCRHTEAAVDLQRDCVQGDASKQLDNRVAATSSLTKQTKCCADKAQSVETNKIGSYNKSDPKRNRLPRISTGSGSVNFRDRNMDAQCETVSVKKQRGMGRTSCMLFTITLAFIVGFLPFLALDAYKSASPEVFASVTGVASSLYHLFLRFCLINSCINPIVYNLFDLKFRSEVMDICGCR
ncbi:hypothetical protein Btru_050650 [Bulinus truncatus]|nr:hypothetical protein Btru_050650 [Bulinus truncatus]